MQQCQFTGVVDVVFASEGIRVLRTPVQAPRETRSSRGWIGTVCRELLDRMLIVHRRHPETVLAEYVGHSSTTIAPTGRCIKQRHLDHCPRSHHRPTFASDAVTGSVD
jgi:hypothetical protein